MTYFAIFFQTFRSSTDQFVTELVLGQSSLTLLFVPNFIAE